MAYNAGVPTPFYHLSVAGELLQHPNLPEPVQTFLQEYRCDFFLGKTAPDVQTVSGQTRPETHFFNVPLSSKTPAWEKMFDRFPQLAQADSLPPSQRAFIAGYICHLQADVTWVWDIFLPNFGLDLLWGSFKHRLFLHNVLRAYLDEQILADLQDGIGTCMQGVQPNGWLPFVRDQDLVKWRDLLAGQLRPGAQIQTVEVFAKRQGVSPEEFSAYLRSEERLESELFSHVTRQELVEYRQTLVEDNINLLKAYFAR